MLDARDLMGIYEVPDYAEASLMEVMRSGLTKMESYAKRHHRFKSRTGALISSISSEIYGLSGRLYIDDFIAPYGVFVHEGQRSWAPDQFIYEAASALSSDLRRNLIASYNKAEKKHNEEGNTEAALALALWMDLLSEEEDKSKKKVEQPWSISQ
jgi:hypothetical protein